MIKDMIKSSLTEFGVVPKPTPQQSQSSFQKNLLRNPLRIQKIPQRERRRISPFIMTPNPVLDQLLLLHRSNLVLTPLPLLVCLFQGVKLPCRKFLRRIIGLSLGFTSTDTSSFTSSIGSNSNSRQAQPAIISQAQP